MELELVFVVVNRLLAATVAALFLLQSAVAGHDLSRVALGRSGMGPAAAPSVRGYSRRSGGKDADYYGSSRMLSIGSPKAVAEERGSSRSWHGHLACSRPRATCLCHDERTSLV
jgi:hypothetical protein